MKTTFLSLAVMALLAACSAPRYTYNFDYHDYNSGKKKGDAVTQQEIQVLEELMLPGEIKMDELIASTDEEVVLVIPAETLKKSYRELSKSEKREVRRAGIQEIKAAIKAKKNGEDAVTATQAMDNDLKLAAVFGAIGITGLFIAGSSIAGQVFYIIGGIAFIIGVVFFVRWLLRQ